MPRYLPRIELSALNRQRLNRRVPVSEALGAEVAVWQQHSTGAGWTDWEFTAHDICIETECFCPSLQA